MYSSRYGFWGYFLLIIGLLGILAFLLFINQDALTRQGISMRQAWILWSGLFSVLMLGGLCSPVWWRWKQKKIHLQYRPEAATAQKKTELHNTLTNLRSFLRTRYGLFWRYKVRLFLIIGEPAEVESIAPGLTGQRWLEGDGIVLIHGGNALAETDADLLASLRKLRRRRPLDGIVWPLTTKESQQAALMDKAWRGLTES